MRQYLNTLEDETTPRTIEEYLGAFTESLKLIMYQNPIERMGHTVLLAAKTALRLKTANPKLKEHEIAGRLQAIARNIRLTTIINDLTPEEKRILKLYPQNKHTPSASQSPPQRQGAAQPGVRVIKSKPGKKRKRA